ncbi:MAG TPA: maleylpyruvate isomerase family mycothiol-dependent enzyme [Gemmatimonadales bacterium]|nr:maleylpyruvate isomerase family mycothiol-dependent enzyme [Gemmatimonadales bacterium]
MSDHRGLRPVGPVFLVGLFPGLHLELMTLLRGLATKDWNRPTACTLWSVKDIVAHLLDSCLRRLSFGRDRNESTPNRSIASYTDLVAYLNRLNAEWIAATRRLSPRLLMGLIDWAEPQLHQYLKSLDPHETAVFGVAWAGEDRSPTWFDIGREYTERWLHQQQIREAVGAPGLTARQWLSPALDIFVRALPFSYRGVVADANTRVEVQIGGEAGGTWTLVHSSEGWQLFVGAASDPATVVSLDQDAAWKLFSKALPPDEARREITITGDSRLGQPFLKTLAVMA